MEVAPRHEMVAFLDSLGTADVDHTGGDFLQHLCGVHDLLLARGASARVAAAGMFHSIYGTETFQGFSLPLDQRPRVQELIGERAEQLAWCNCVMDRASFDASLGDALAGAEQLEIRDRDGSPIVLSLDELRELAEVQLFDWLEQVERVVSDDSSADSPEQPSGWGYRRRAYRQMAELVGRRGLWLYGAVFSREPVAPQD